MDVEFYFFLIIYICQIPSVAKKIYTGISSLASNLIYFTVSFICYWTFNTTKKNSVIYFRLDYIGIILHIWAIFFSVSILEITEGGKYGYGAIGIILAGLIVSIYPFALPFDKIIRVILIDRFGGLSFLFVPTLVLASGKMLQ